MRRWRAWLVRLGGMFRRTQREAELSTELESHVQSHVEDAMRAGMSREQASRDARLKLGGIEQTKERYRDQRTLPWLESFLQDLHLAARMLRKNAGFTLIAVLTLALGIGANTAIFSLINALMLCAVPARDPGSLVELLHQYPGEPALNGFSWDAYQLMRANNHVLADLIVDSHESLVVRGQNLAPHTVFAGYLSGRFFEALGLRAATGRLMGKEADDLSHPAPVAVVSWSYWKGRFNLDPAILGKQVIVNGTPVTIIGVAEQGFNGLTEGFSQDVWLPLSMEPVIHQSPLGWGSLDLIGRLKPGVSVGQARAELAVLFQSAIEAPGAGPYVRKMVFEMEPAGNGLSTPLRLMLRTPLLVLMAIVSLVLLIACANLGGLLLARGASRTQEMAIRACLGAGRFRLMRQTLTESLLLSLLGTFVAVFLAYFGSRGLLKMITSGRDIIGLPVNLDALTYPNAQVLVFTASLSLLTTLLFGLAPALTLGFLPASTLQQRARIGESRSRRLFGKSLIAMQVAVSIVLLSAAASFVSYVSHLRNLNLGFRRDHLLLVNLDLAHSGYDGEQWARLSGELLAQCAALPGVRSATLSGMTPMLGMGASSFATVKGHPENHREVSINFVSPHYFESYGTPLLAGRDFSLKDQGGPLVAIINETMARDYFGMSNPIGSYVTLDHVTLRGDDAPTYQVVGVVGDAKYNELQQPTPGTIYLHAFQEGRIVSQLTLRTAIAPEGVAISVRKLVGATLKTVPVVRINTMADQIDAAIVPERLTASLSTWFGALGALLAAFGLYGLLAYTVSRRTNEIGVRMALGASGGKIMRMVLTEALGIVTAGVLLGVPLAFWARKIAASLIQGLPANQSLSVVAGSSGMLVVAFLAVYWPARRAAKVDPIVALRYQ